MTFSQRWNRSTTDQRRRNGQPGSLWASCHFERTRFNAGQLGQTGWHSRRPPPQKSLHTFIKYGFFGVGEKIVFNKRQPFLQETLVLNAKMDLNAQTGVRHPSVLGLDLVWRKNVAALTCVGKKFQVRWMSDFSLGHFLAAQGQPKVWLFDFLGIILNLDLWQEKFSDLQFDVCGESFHKWVKNSNRNLFKRC